MAITFHAKASHVTLYQAWKCREINANYKLYISREYTEDRPAKQRHVFNRIVTDGN